MKKEEGITLIALIITIVVLSILLGIGVGSLRSKRGTIKESQATIDSGDIKKVEQAVGEVYIKYLNTKNATLLKGVEKSYDDAKQLEQEELKRIDENIRLKQSRYDLTEDRDTPEKFYYYLTGTDLEQIGISNFEEGVEYLVNYSTGEVYKIN